MCKDSTLQDINSMKKIFVFATLFASATFSFAKPNDKDLKLNRG